MVTRRTCQRRHLRVPPHLVRPPAPDVRRDRPRPPRAGPRQLLAGFLAGFRGGRQAAPRWSASQTAVLSRAPSRTASAQCPIQYARPSGVPVV